MHRSPPDGSLPRRRRLLGQLARPRTLGLLGVLACAGAAMLPTGAAVDRTSTANAAPANTATGPGNGFVVTPGDLMFILKNIKISERHAAAFKGDTDAAPANPDVTGDPTYCQALLGTADDQVPDALTSYGLRTVDGSCNNLVKNSPALDKRDRFGAADQIFPRLTPQNYRAAEDIPAGFFCPDGVPGCPPGGVPAVATPSSYANHVPGNVVVDSQPRLISNLIVDQTSTNPAAVDVAANPARTQANPDRVFACGSVGAPPPPDCVPAHHTLFIPNVTTDVGLSPPFNSWFTFFGQFFDHGVDQTVKSDGTVFVPLRPDDPLLQPGGADGDPATPGDQANPQSAFIAITRATVKRGPGPDGILGNADDTYDAFNTDTPWVDQSQTYTSHSSHQAFLREYTLVGGKPVDTGAFLDGLPAGQTYLNSPDGAGGMASWAAIKKQAHDLLGLQLIDRDVTNVPALAVDPYGNFIPGPNGRPQFVCAGQCIDPLTNAVEGSGNTVEGDPALVNSDTTTGVLVPKNVQHFDTPFLTDIAHNADPSPVDTDHNPATPPVAPTPDLDNTPSADFASQPAGTYDDEMLNAHFVCGDGRCNENIALSTVHTIFHMEHNRLVTDIDATLHKPENAALLADFQAQHLLAPSDDVSFGYGGRLFQAARFVTEMEYQHLVFEEFARKVVPAIRPFHVYSTDVNPAIEAEFAHAMYRFGHSMLDDTVARSSPVLNADGSTTMTDNSLPLLTAFLNPPSFFDNSAVAAANPGTNPVYTAKQAVSSIVMGSTDQTGNEIDEFVTETLRNNLLGLPLDLPAINMARARSEGIPPLNSVRRVINAQTHDASLAPYTSWSDFGQHLKHPQSLVNFVAAYGLHPSITGVSTIADKRAAAQLIVDGGPGAPADAAAFMFSTGTWASDPATHKTTTGLDNVDLWVGGLAEVTNLFGGMLGSTFNYIFQTQLEKLQDDDRFYYLNRTPGMNLRSQLEGNSFAEMIMRNTNSETPVTAADTPTTALKADVFATADCKFQLGAISGPETVAVAGANPPTLLGAGTVHDDPATTDCDENQLLLQKPDGTIQYRARNTVDPAGINGQSVYYGTDGIDRVIGGNDNDTFWGGKGADIIEANGGDDLAFGGNGDDIITDLDGADILEGGPGNDAIDAGPGDDITIGNDGQDFIQNGMNDNETFAGEGNDFIEAGAGADGPFGDGGDDWFEGGSGQDIMFGDHSAPFFDDPAETKPGNDIMIGQVGENDYDVEGGDDIMEQNPGIDRNAGAAGFDWAIHQTDTAAADDDLAINQGLFGLPLQVVVNRDRWGETEADTGSDNFADIIRGDSLERIVGPAGFSGCDALDNAGVNRIAGLRAYVNTFPTLVSDVIAASAMKRCPLTGSGPNDTAGTGVWAEGNILMGGGKSDVIEGRGNDDIIDGDHSLNVYISVRQGVDANGKPTGPEIARTDLMEHPALSGSFGLGVTPSMTLEEAVFADPQIINPGQLLAVREIQDIPAPGAAQGALIPAGASPDTGRASTCDTVADFGIHNSNVPSLTANCDVSEYSSGPENFTVTPGPGGSFIVTDQTTVAAAVGAVGPIAKGDGIDTLWNMEALRFCIANDPVSKNCIQWQTLAIDDPALTGAGGPANAVAIGGSPRLFGSLAVGTGPATQAIVIRNAGGGFLTGGTATITGLNAADFTITTDGCDTTVLGGGGTCVVNVGFSPAAAGARTAILTVPTDAGNVTVTLNGTGTAVATTAQATIAKPAAFGTRRIGDPLVTRTVAVRNDGTANLTISSATSSTSAFTVDLGTCNVPVAPTKTCKLNVTFVPALPIGPKVATLTVVSNASNSPTTVGLSGASKEAAVVVGALRIVQPATRATVKPVNVSLHVSTAASIRLQVRNARGRLVWSKSIKATRAGTAKLRWNLRDSKGHRVKKGKYVFTITVVDNTGFKVTVKRTIRVR